MVRLKRILWSTTAQKQRNNILEYWNNRNRSTAYSKKLNKIVKENTIRLLTQPHLGKPTNAAALREMVVSDYSVFYKAQGENIRVMFFWDNRQDPNKLNELLNK